MGTTDSGYIFPDPGYLSGWRQAVEDLADSAEDVLTGSHAFQTFRVADSSGLNALESSFTLAAGDLARRGDNGIIYRWTGSAWKAWESEWIDWVPTWTNLVTTGATITTAYKYGSGEFELRGSVTLGSGTSFSGDVTIDNVPVSMASGFGLGEYTDVGTAYNPLIVSRAGNNQIRISPMNSASTLLARANLGDITEASGDSFVFRMRGSVN